MKQLSTIRNLLVPVLRHYRFIMLFGLIAMLAGSCQKDHIKKTVPFKGSFAVSTEDGIHGTGNAIPIGNFTLVANDDESNFPNITGTVIITLASGEQIFATHTGFATEFGKNMVKVDFDNTITGGTGRFAGATGSFEMHAVVDETLSTGTATLDGTINY